MSFNCLSYPLLKSLLKRAALLFCLLLSVSVRAQPPAQEHKDQTGEAAALVGQARLLLYDQPASARTLYEKALLIYREIPDKSGQAECLFNLGNCAALLKQRPQALTQYEAACKLYQETGEAGGQGLARLMTGNVYHDMGQAAKALPYYAQAVALFVEAKDPKRQAKALVSLSRSYLELRDADNGLKYLEQARPLSEEANDTDTLLVIAHNLAGVYAYQNEYSKAIESFQQVLPRLENNGDPKQVAACLSNLGFLTFRVGDFLKSLTYLTQAVATCEAGKDTSGLSTALDHLAADYSYLGQRDKALELEKRALQAGKDCGNFSLQADALTNLARIYGQLQNAAAEKAAVEAALALYRQIGNQNGEAFALHALASNCLLAGDTARAMRLDAEARTLFERTRDPYGVAATLLQSGDITLDSGRPDALEDYRKAFDLYQSLGYVFGEGSALTGMGECEERQGNTSEAELFYRQALLRQETLRSSLGSLTEAKSRFLDKNFALYPHYLGLLMQSKQDVPAFEWAQKTKARALIDLLNAANVSAAPRLKPEERKRQEELRGRGNNLTRRWLASVVELNDLKRQVKPDATRKQKVEKQAREVKRDQQILERDYSAFRDSVALHDPQNASAQATHTVTLAEVGTWLPEDTALLEYAAYTTGYGGAKRESLALFVVTQKQGRARLRVCRIATDASSLARKTQELREACAEGPGTVSERPYKPLARELYSLLIAPAEPELAGIRRLILCPDGPLWDAPFQALLRPAPLASGNGKPVSEFLWERYALAYAYSATATEAALASHSRRNRPQASQSLLVMANPDFGTEAAAPAVRNRALQNAIPDESAQNPLQRGGSLSALPYTQVEADAIHAAYPDATLKTGKDAQEGLLKQTAANYRYLHFATHAIFNEAAPMLSGVALASPPKGGAEDGILTARELLDLKLSADLIVFSACETARGENRRGEGLIGLTWAAFAAGVPAQIVSQWSVDDEATARLMGAFYRGLKQGQTKDAALRQAALSLLRDGQHDHPFYWAPFLLMGDWR